MQLPLMSATQSARTITCDACTAVRRDTAVAGQLQRATNGVLTSSSLCSFFAAAT